MSMMEMIKAMMVIKDSDDEKGGDDVDDYKS